MIVTPLYHIILLGVRDARADAIKAALTQRIAALGMDADALAYLGASEIMARDLAIPAMAIFFGGVEVATDTAEVRELIEESIPIVPLVSDLKRVRDEIPPQLRNINASVVDADGSGTERIASLVCETFRLLRAERRLFISYKREDSQPLADRLYDALDKRGFDVFIDTRSVPPADTFQDVLWHRLSDSDVVVLLDTEHFHESPWTTEELQRANSTNIQILHVLFPGRPEDETSGFSHFFRLTNENFVGGIVDRGQSLSEEVIDHICDMAERLRARAMAARYAYLVDAFCDAARDLGLVPDVQPERWIRLPTKEGRSLAVVPVVGLPTSSRINAVFDAIDDDGSTRDRWIIFDSRGLLQAWLTHLDWLSSHLPVKAIWASNAPAQLKGLV